MLFLNLKASWLALLIVCLHLVLASQDEQKPLRDRFPTEEDRNDYRARGGNTLIHQTWNILRELEPTWKESSTVAGSAPGGIAGTMWYYGKIIFKALFMNSPSQHGGDNVKLSPELRNCIETLVIGAEYEDADAIFLLAEMNFYGNFSHPRNVKESFQRYQQLANLDGNGTAQHMLGLMYATGIGAPTRDQARALIHHTFAAETGNVQSEMTLAYRYHQGIGTGRDCNQAADYYKRVADKAMDWWHSGPPGGHHIPRNAVRWAEYAGGAYGEGASFSSSGHNAQKEGTIITSFDDVIEFLDMRQRQGDYTSMLALGKHYYEPPRGYKRNFRSAQKQFNNIAREYWGKDGKVKSKIPKGIEKNAGKAAAYIGRMFMRGEGVEQNYEKALTWFRRGVANGDAYSQYHIGIMYRDGLGVPRDGSKAATYLKAAAEQSLPIAQSAVGVLFLDQGDVETAGRYFELAGSAGVMEGFYYLAELTHKGVGRKRDCGLSVAYYKVVAEKAEQLHSSFVEANSAFERGDLETAFMASIGAAEQGYENAQANIAFLLDQRTSVISLPSIPLLSNPFSMSPSGRPRRSKLLNNHPLALAFYTRSAQQANIDSLLKMGDIYLTGVDPNSTIKVGSGAKPSNTDTDNIHYRDLAKASSCYTTAAESHHSAQALWNLGWMHENGIGPVEKDFHMAKRYYDMALEMNKEAYLPVKLALLKLRIHSWWNGISGGTVKPMGSDDDAENRPKTFWEWLSRFLDAAEEMDAQEYAELARQAREAEDGGLDGFAYGEAGAAAGDNDYYYDGTAGEDYLGDVDDGLIESLIIVALAGALAMLVYARQQRQREARDRRDREEGQRAGNGPAGGAVQGVAGQQQPQNGPQDRGLFPRAEDPDFANWVAGGIGH